MWTGLGQILACVSKVGLAIDLPQPDLTGAMNTPRLWHPKRLDHGLAIWIHVLAIQTRHLPDKHQFHPPKLPHYLYRLKLHDMSILLI